MKAGKIILIALCLFAFVASCKNDHKHEAQQATTYTCPMHPQIIQEKAGTCPICGMDLVIFDRSGKDGYLTLNERQVALANITTIIEGDSSMSGSVVLNARIVADARNKEVVSARIDGRIEKLFVRETGVQIVKGQPLYSIYSESLSALQEEYLIAAAQKKEFPDDRQFAHIEEAARKKLLLLGQSPDQIQKLSISGKTNPVITFYAEVAGVIAALDIQQGAYVKEGDALISLENYENVWVEADIYPSERSRVKRGDLAMVSIPGSAEQFTTRIDFVTPEIDANAQQLQIRGSIDNKNRTITPGMPAVLKIANSSSDFKTIPTDAVIRDGRGEHIWIEESKGKFLPRRVTTGKTTADRVEVLTGIEAGDRIVATGAYLLYSEYLLKKGNIHLNNHQH